MSSFRIAVIAGDGIGQEVIPAGIAAIEARDARHRRVGVVQRSAVELRLLPRARADDGRGRLRADGDVRRAVHRRARRAGRVGRRVGGPDPRHPPEVRSVREPAADAAAGRAELAAGQPRRRGHRHGLRARELRRRVLRRRRTDPSRHAARGRAAGRRLHAARHRADSALRLRGRREAAAQDARQRDQVQRAHALDGAVGRGRGDRARRTIRRSSTASTTSTRSRRG